MGTIVGIVIGVIATILVSHHYYRRSTRRSLTPYRVLSSDVFAGIEPDVREQLHFSFRDREVKDLHHLEFLVANDGDRAISNLIEPLTLDLPSGVEVLDASILHRNPRTLQASIKVTKSESQQGVVLEFPLLNKNEFERMPFTLLAEDLPRRLAFKWLPPSSLRERKVVSEGAAIAVGVAMIAMAAAEGLGFFMLRGYRPDLFPYPWTTFQLSWTSAFLLSFGLLGAAALAVFGAIFAVGIGLEELWSRGPRFPLPKEFRKGHLEIPLELLRHELEEASESLKESRKDEK